MDHDITPFVVHEGYIEDHRTDGLRSGEGCVAPLPDGSLYMVYGRFTGPQDHDPAVLFERRSTDGGRRWSRRKVFLPTPKDALNLMSVSLLPLRDGRLAAVFLRKNSVKEDCRPRFMTSGDGGRSWSASAYMTDQPGYYVVNNDRLVQLSGGRLAAPYAWHGRPFNQDLWGVRCGCFLSDDLGATWRKGRMEIKVEAENVLFPKLVDPRVPDIVKDIREGHVQCQEPGLVELADGRVFMWCRTPGGYAYGAFSADGCETWSPFKAVSEFAMPCGPQSVLRLPGSGRLVMLFNDREGVPYGHEQWHWRRPLTVAVSDDNAATWRRHGLLEPASVPSTCYYSLCLHGENVVFTYYEGVMTARGGFYAPRNLASLKLKIVRRAYFDL
jgi:hypothetical protein